VNGIRKVRMTIPRCRKFLTLVLLVLFFLSGCLEIRPPLLGLASKYKTARADLIKHGGRGLRTAVPLLEEIVQTDPFYLDTLTLLGRAYYQQKGYQDALQFLQRAVVVNKEDEIAWLALGLTQLRLGVDGEGLENFKRGLSLLINVSKGGYRDYEFWDRNGLVRHSIRRAIFRVQKDELRRKDLLIKSGELILRRMNEEETYQFTDRIIAENIR